MGDPVSLPSYRPYDLVPADPSPLIGDVAEYDEARGLGVIEYGPARQVAFHCTAITDGSRLIAVGTVVAFVVSAGRLGRLEASSVRPLPGVVPRGNPRSANAGRAPSPGMFPSFLLNRSGPVTPGGQVSDPQPPVAAPLISAAATPVTPSPLAGLALSRPLIDEAPLGDA